MGTLAELFIVFFKLGAFTIGGGIAMLPLLQNSMINEKKWFTEDEFVDVVAICQSLPGVVAVNMATYVGYKKKGFAGSAVSTIAVVMPSFFIILIIATFLSSIEDNPFVQGAMAGFRAAALGLVIVAIIQLAPSVFKGVRALVYAAASFILIAVFNVNTAYVIVLFLLLGIASTCFAGRKALSAAKAENAPLADADGKAEDRTVLESKTDPADANVKAADTKSKAVKAGTDVEAAAPAAPDIADENGRQLYPEAPGSADVLNAEVAGPNSPDIEATCPADPEPESGEQGRSITKTGETGATEQKDKGPGSAITASEGPGGVDTGNKSPGETCAESAGNGSATAESACLGETVTESACPNGPDIEATCPAAPDTEPEGGERE